MHLYGPETIVWYFCGEEYLNWLLYCARSWVKIIDSTTTTLQNSYIIEGTLVQSCHPYSHTSIQTLIEAAHVEYLRIRVCFQRYPCWVVVANQTTCHRLLFAAWGWTSKSNRLKMVVMLKLCGTQIWETHRIMKNWHSLSTPICNFFVIPHGNTLNPLQTWERWSAS